MATNQENDLSFLEKKDANALTGKDILYTIFRNLHWIILCAIVGAAIAWFVSATEPTVSTRVTPRL